MQGIGIGTSDFKKMSILKYYFDWNYKDSKELFTN